jgi:hypothetical protein
MERVMVAIPGKVRRRGSSSEPVFAAGTSFPGGNVRPTIELALAISSRSELPMHDFDPPPVHTGGDIMSPALRQTFLILDPVC